MPLLPSLALLVVLSCQFSVLVRAQESSQDLIFNTTFPVTYIIGQRGNVTWSGGNGTPVNASLADGTTDLQIICTDTLNTFCEWIPSTSITPEVAYALKLSQAITGNFTEGPVAIEAASSSSGITSSSTASTATGTSSSATSTPSGSTSPTPSSSNLTSSTTSSSLGAGAIAGIVVGAIVGLALIAIVVWWALKRRISAALPPAALPPSAKSDGYSEAELDGEMTTEGGHQAIPRPAWQGQMEIADTQVFEAGYNPNPRVEIGQSVPRYELASGQHEYVGGS